MLCRKNGRVLDLKASDMYSYNSCFVVNSSTEWYDVSKFQCQQNMFWVREWNEMNIQGQSKKIPNICGLFPVPKVEVHPKRSPISDDRGDKRKFATGPSRNPAKHVPGCVPELEKSLGAVYQQ